MGIFSSSRDRRRAMERWHEELAEERDRSKRRLSHLGDDARGHLDHARARLHDGQERAVDYGQRAAYGIDRHVHENSWSYIAAGAVVGLAAGVLLGRRRW
ncbi:glycine zipper domain-containing protein [Larsenimonas salina]|uniref:glycine zipper domain-containing protein n=1 Tax=Larsenimonas salina TaxID=1295565 RepID=UPI0020741213|nr:hypothetical protein [Larsenimonas salina]MCM5704378.1 hypothetical protein [Larsenimonas salina]